MIEFAFTFPIFVFLLVSVINGGLFFYARNAVEHASDIGFTTLAAEGNSPTADSVAFQRMRDGGLQAGVFNVSYIDIFKETQNVDGSFTDAGPADHYLVDGTQTGSPQTYDPAARAPGKDWVKLQITYKFPVFGFGWASPTLISTKIFRLEPN